MLNVRIGTMPGRINDYVLEGEATVKCIRNCRTILCWLSNQS